MDLRYNNIVVKFFLILLCIFNVIHTSNGLSNLKSMYMHNFEKAKEYSCAVNSLKWNMLPQYGFLAHSRTEFEKEKRSHLYSYFKNKQWFGDENKHNKIEVESEHPVITILEGMREQTRNKLGNLLSHKENLQREVLGLNPINFSSHLCGMKHSNGCGYSGDTLLQKVKEFIKEEGSLLKKDIKKPNLQEHEESCYGKICELTKEIIVSEKERDGDLYALCDTLFEKIEKEKVSDRPEIPQSRISNIML